MKSHLLDDSQMAAFVQTGVQVVHSRLPEEVHGEIGAAVADLCGGDKNPANAIYNEVDGLRQVLECAAVAGALQSLLGADYRLQCHRHAHVLPPSGSAGLPRAQRFHQDGTEREFEGWNRPWRRWHRPRKLNVFYYPHDVWLERGPTEVVAGSQYWGAFHAAFRTHSRPLIAPAGTVALTHYNLWHRGTINLCAEPRVMVKFVFERAAEPAGPSWAADPAFLPDFAGSGPLAPLAATSQNIWSWLCGKREAVAPTEEAAILWSRAVQARETATTIAAAYELARHGGAAVAKVEKAFLGADPQARERAALVLSAAGEAALPLLERCLAADRGWLRATALDLLADLGREGLGAQDRAARMIDDPCAWVRHNLMQALEIWGRDAAAHQEAALRGLEDEEPFVCFNAIGACLSMDLERELYKDQLVSLARHAHQKLAWKAREVLAAK